MKLTQNELSRLIAAHAAMLGISPSQVTLTQNEDLSFTVTFEGKTSTGSIEHIGRWLANEVQSKKRPLKP